MACTITAARCGARDKEQRLRSQMLGIINDPGSDDARGNLLPGHAEKVSRLERGLSQTVSELDDLDNEWRETIAEGMRDGSVQTEAGTGMDSFRQDASNPWTPRVHRAR